MPALPLPTPLIDALTSPLPGGALYPEDYHAIIHFLRLYEGNRATLEAYRRELERLLQWSWLIAKKSVLQLAREDIEHYIQFCMQPPKTWIAKKHVPRYFEKQGQRKPNPQWRPFLAKINKSEHKEGKKPSAVDYQMSPSSIRALFAISGSFYDHLLLDEKVQKNPIALIRQKSRYLQKQQTTRQVIRLSDKQWQACLNAAKSMRKTAGNVHQRTLFIITAMYLMYLRISEFAANERWTPLMNHFYQDSHEQWWFKTLGKGNKLRTIAVSDNMLNALISYRKELKLTPLPSPSDNSPLVPKIKGQGPMESTRHIRRLIQACFDQAIIQLREKNHSEEADTLETATVHWLRHTGISDDVNKRGRPMMHVRDDAGHASVVTTEKYSDVETKDRHQSAKMKTINIRKDKHKKKSL